MKLHVNVTKETATINLRLQAKILSKLSECTLQDHYLNYNFTVIVNPLIRILQNVILLDCNEYTCEMVSYTVAKSL